MLQSMNWKEVMTGQETSTINDRNPAGIKEKASIGQDPAQTSIKIGKESPRRFLLQGSIWIKDQFVMWFKIMSVHSSLASELGNVFHIIIFFWSMKKYEWRDHMLMHLTRKSLHKALTRHKSAKQFHVDIKVKSGDNADPYCWSCQSHEASA